MTVDALIKNAASAHFLAFSLSVQTGCLLLFRNMIRGQVALATAQGILALKIPSSVFWTQGWQRNPLSKEPSHMCCWLFSLRVHQSRFGQSRKRFELDPESLEDVLRIQIDSRLREADIPPREARIDVRTLFKGYSCLDSPYPFACLVFFAICHSSPCTAKNERGQACTGIPKLVKFNNVCLALSAVLCSAN